ILGGNQQWNYNITSPYSRQALESSGGSTIIGSESPGIAYDQAEDRIIAWQGGNPFALNMETKVWTQLTFSNNPGSGLIRGTNGRWSYVPSINSFVLVNGVDKDAYLFRWSKKLGTGEITTSLKKSYYSPLNKFQIRVDKNIDILGRLIFE
ncbi:MAG: hypothetical protein AABY22_21195, partial [Nanoarchaeota archaeon]